MAQRMAGGATPGGRIRPRELASAGALLDRASELTTPRTDPLTVVAGLRREFPEAEPALVGEAATQARLRARAAPRLGPRAERLVLSDAGLQQASRWAVATYRAGELRRRLGAPETAVSPLVADLGCGLGIDALALAEAGFRVRGVEKDPWTAEAAAVNCAGQPAVAIVEGDAVEADLRDCAAAYCDPARRDPDAPMATHGRGRTARVVDPALWSPPWPWVVEVSNVLPTVAKAAPGLRESAVPLDAEREWIEVDGEVVECCVWFAPLGHPGMRRATVLLGGVVLTLGSSEPDSAPDATATPDDYLLEPAAAVRRAALVGALADDLRTEGTPVRRMGDWLTSPRDPESGWVRAWQVKEALPRGSRALRDALRTFGPITWKTDAVRESAEAVDRRVGHRPAAGGPSATVVMLDDGSAWLASRVPQIPRQSGDEVGEHLPGSGASHQP